MEKEMKCKNCNVTFQSRNQLFKHLKICFKTENEGEEEHIEEKEKKRLKREEIDEELLKKDLRNFFVYVVGGRLRGRTLCTVHKYNLEKNDWESSKSMLDNRGSHGTIFINGILYAIGRERNSFLLSLFFILFLII